MSNEQNSPIPQEDQEETHLDHQEISPNILESENQNPISEALVIFEEKSCEMCPICDAKLNEVNQLIVPDCFHKFCNSCIATYITLRVQDSQVSKMPCPQHTCKFEVPIDLIKAVLTPEYFEKYQKFKRREELNRNPNLRWCPLPDCEGYDTGSTKKRQLICNKCGYNYCYYCSEAWHEGLACKAQTDYVFDNWSKENGIKFCPFCTRRVQKAEGCDHMTCPVCKYEWCWLCGEKYHPEHYDICKVRIMEKLNPKWSAILVLMFCILIAPFFYIFLCMRAVHRSPNKNKVSKVCIYPATLIFALCLTPFVYVGFICCCGYIWLNKFCLRAFKTKRFLIRMINGLLSIVLSPVFACAVVIMLIWMTFKGFSRAFIKISFIIKNRSNPDYMKPMDDYVDF